MKLYKVVGLIFLLSSVGFGALPAMAMSQEEIVDELKALSQKISTLEHENAELRSRVASLETGSSPSLQTENSAHTASEKDDIVQAALDAIKGGKEVVHVGRGSLSIGGLIQAWWQYSDVTENTFRFRRSEIKFYGDILPSLKFYVMIDPAKTLSQNQTVILEDGKTAGTALDTTIKQSSRILQDVYITWVTPIEHWVVDFGQYKMPITEEGYHPASRLDTIERANAFLTFADKRDIGIMLKGFYPLFDFYGGIFNGEESNIRDKNDHKDVLFRGVFRPFGLTEGLLKKLELGGGAYAGESGTENLDKDRYWGEGRWEWERFSVKGEYLAIKEASTDEDGWYVQGGFYLLPQKLQGILKYDVFDLNTDQSGDEEDDYTVGLNWFLCDYNAKVQLNYIYKDFENSKTEDENQVISALQVAF